MFSHQNLYSRRACLLLHYLSTGTHPLILNLKAQATVSDSDKRQGLLFVLVGPSGVGKNTLLKHVVKEVENLRQLPTFTTRGPRQGEQEGKQHYFVSVPEFQRRLASGEMVEWQQVHEGTFYGTPLKDIEEAISANCDLIADIDVLGATALRSVYADNTVLIFIQPPDRDELRRRLEKRGEETPEQIEKRLDRAEMEMQYAPICDYLILNDDEDAAAEVLRSIILAERSRRALLNLRAERNLPRHKFAYLAAVMPVYGHEVLLPDELSRLPATHLLQGEYPYEAALRLLSETFKVRASSDQLLALRPHDPFMPVMMEMRDQSHFQQLIFVYLCRLNERIVPPEGWRWRPVDEANLPGLALNALNAQGVLEP